MIAQVILAIVTAINLDRNSTHHKADTEDLILYKHLEGPQTA